MDITNKFWNFCNKLRHDGVDSADYIEQLTYLLFLKMADEKSLYVPSEYNWHALLNTSSENLVAFLEKLLQELKKERGILGEIFAEPVSRVKNGEILKKLIEEINSIAWTEIDADVVGIAFEELIGRVADEGKKGAGQYFTPRPLINSIVNVMQPNPFLTNNFKVADVACGTCGFLMSACEWAKKHRPKKVTKKQIENFETNTFFGTELVQRPRRLALMNLFLHGIDANKTVRLDDSIDGKQDDILYDMILSNPPFGNKGAQPTTRNFPVKTSDKQLNFIQHIIGKLKDGGTAAIVLPDSCLSSSNARKIWAHYMVSENSGANVCNVHTILKLPEGVFAAYANGVKASVIFLEKGKPTETLWLYDMRKDIAKITKKSNALHSNHFTDFEIAYFNRKQSDRFKSHSINEVIHKEFDILFVEITPPQIIPDFKIIIEEQINSLKQQIEVLERMKLTYS